MPTTIEQKAEGWVSVTEVLDAFIPKGLLDWYLRTGKAEANRLSKAALKIGGRVDEIIQSDVLIGKYTLTAKDGLEVRNCIEAWESFKKDYKPVINSCQYQVKDEVQKVIGHIDLVINGRTTDIKCATSIKPNYWIQTDKYDSMSKFQSDGTAILRLDKNLATYQYMTNDQAGIKKGVGTKVFDGLLEAYRYYNPQRGTEE